MATNYAPHLIVSIILFAAAANLPACYQTDNPAAKPAHAARTEPRQYIVDLPEEFQNSTGNDLQVEFKNDTFFISFRTEVYNQCYTAHTCTDSTHQTCDGVCPCDGMECN